MGFIGALRWRGEGRNLIKEGTDSERRTRKQGRENRVRGGCGIKRGKAKGGSRDLGGGNKRRRREKRRQWRKV